MPMLVQRNWLQGREAGRCCDRCFESSATIAGIYARADRKFGDRPGRAYGWRSRVRGDKSKLAEDGYLLSPRDFFDLCGGGVVFAIAPTTGERRLEVVLRDDAAEHFARVAVDAHDAERPFALGQLAQQAVKASRGRVSPPTRPLRV
jgi:hypothetical protein